MNIKKQILRITQTAMLLGLTVAAQYFLTGLLGATLISQLVVGSLVNFFLILATLLCGFWSGFSISILAPFISLAIGRMPHIWMIPFVALGNIAIVFVFWIICVKKIFGSKFTVNWAAASVFGSLLKFAVLWLGVTKMFVNFFLVKDSPLSAVISINYSFPQLATALIGSVLIYAIYPVLKKTILGETEN